MRSLPILFCLSVVVLARNGDPCGSDSVSILGKELKSIMMRPKYDMPHRVQRTQYSWIEFCNALVTFTNNRLQTVMIVHRTNKNRNEVMLDVCIESSEQKITFTLGPPGVLTKRKNPLPHDDKVDNNEVDDDEVFHVLRKSPDPHKTELESLPPVSQYVTFTEFYVEPLTQLLDDVARKCSTYCARPEIASADTNTLALHITAERPLPYAMRLRCDEEMVDLVYQNNDDVKVFKGGIGKDDTPLSYNWTTKTYLNNTDINNSKRWVSIQYDKKKKNYIPEPLNFAHAGGVQVLLSELLDDLNGMCRLMWDSNNFSRRTLSKPDSGIVALDDKVILTLSRRTLSATNKCLVKFMDMSSNDEKLVLKHDLIFAKRGTGSKINISKTFRKFILENLPTTSTYPHCCVSQYINLGTIKRLVLHLSDNISTVIDKSDPNKKRSRLSVDLVYNTHSVFRVFFSGEREACSTDLKVLKAVSKSNFLTIFKKSDVEFVCFTRILDNGAFITPGRLLLNDGFAVKLETYEPPNKDDTSRYEYQEIKIPYDENWKAYIKLPKEK